MSSDSSPTRDAENPDRCDLSTVELQTQDQAADNDEQAHDEPDVPSKNELLVKLGHLAGCVAMGVLPPPRANSMRGIYATMLSHLDEAATDSAGALSDESVLKTLREHPELLKFIKPLLTKEQLALIIREAPND